MKVTARMVCALGWAAPLVPPPAAAQAVEQARADLRFLASDRLAGRFTGTVESDSAAAYLARRFRAVGARPPAGGALVEFSIAPGIPGLREMPPAERPTRGVNVVGVIRGRDPALRDQAVVVGAHYDHLGRGQSHQGSLAPDSVGAIHHGADDNASGTVALLEIARRLAAAPPKRSVIVVAFAGEELGLLGSAAYVRNPVVPLDRTVAMLNLDMVGRLRGDRLLVYGSETAAEFPSLLDSLNRGAHFALAHSGDGYGRSDQQSFYVAGTPVLHFFTDLHEDYHRPSDAAEKVNVAGLVRVADFAADLARVLADRPAPLTLVVKPPPAATTAASGSGYGAYLGSIPDMSGGGPGVRLSGVRSGSPAERAGLKGGDVLLRIGRFEVGDLQAMTTALRAHHAGDTVVVVFRREAAVDSTVVVFGQRSN
jgi:hypothetical protein